MMKKNLINKLKNKNWKKFWKIKKKFNYSKNEHQICSGIGVEKFSAFFYVFPPLLFVLAAGMSVEGVISGLRPRSPERCRKLHSLYGQAELNSDAFALWRAFDRWTAQCRQRTFQTRQDEKRWCEANLIDLARMKEVRLLIYYHFPSLFFITTYIYIYIHICIYMYIMYYTRVTLKLLSPPPPLPKRKRKIYSSNWDSIISRCSLWGLDPLDRLSQDWKKGKKSIFEMSLNIILTPWSTSLRVKTAIPRVLSLHSENRGEY